MSTATPPSKPAKGDPLPKAPPDEKFWERYSPHYEFPLSTVASIALHVVVAVLVILIISRLMKPDEKTPVPIRGMVVQNDSPGGLTGAGGSGGGEEKKEAEENTRPENPQRNIPEVELNREKVSVSAWAPDLKDNPEALKKIVESANYDKLKDLNDDIKKRLAQGFGDTKGKGPNKGMGDDGPGAKGAGSGGAGDASTSGNRSQRWTIVFKTTSGIDYLKQLNAFEAKIVIPQPPNWKTNRLFTDLLTPNEGKPLGDEELPKMYFSDSDAGSARKVAEALGLTYKPPYIIAFFPKNMEEKLAGLEKKFRNRKEDEIFSTTFRVLESNGVYEIRVTDQIPTRK